MTKPTRPILLGIALSCLVVASTVQAKEQLVLAIGGEPEQGFDPLLGWGQYGNPLFQSTLLSRGKDLAPQPELATEWWLSEDRLTWTLTLREDARFADGTPLTAEDVAYTFNAAAQAGGRADLSALAKATALGKHTVSLRLKAPRITFIDQLLTLGVVPHAERDNGYSDQYGRHPLGSGPYQLVEWQEGEQLIVERNPYFYGPTPAFERLVFLFTGEDATRSAAHAGQVDIASVPPALAANVPAHMQRVIMESVDNRGILFPMQPANGEHAASGAPIGNNVTADIAIRQAINLAVDRDTLVEVALHGYGRPAFGPADGLPWSDSDERLAAPDLDRGRRYSMPQAGSYAMMACAIKVACPLAFDLPTPPAIPPDSCLRKSVPRWFVHWELRYNPPAVTGTKSSAKHCTRMPLCSVLAAIAPRKFTTSSTVSMRATVSTTVVSTLIQRWMPTWTPPRRRLALSKPTASGRQRSGTAPPATEYAAIVAGPGWSILSMSILPIPA
ncbi:ABC transporter substrate-binding protein [Halomonas sp. PA16-9]|uniref:ABC transporter substrate-binding protein n=1 Tax=Halomonas sp. PA16-9 TaxID=2576841 RepID=UPI0030EE0F13